MSVVRQMAQALSWICRRASYSSGVRPYFCFSQAFRLAGGLLGVLRRTVMHSCDLRDFLTRILVGPQTEQIAVLPSVSTSLSECLAVDMVAGYSSIRPSLRILL